LRVKRREGRHLHLRQRLFWQIQHLAVPCR
jgi:hypothetical protein